MAVVLKHSRQRDAILELLRSVRSHPTADWIYFELKKDMPDLSLGTVYRNLSLLAKLGEIVELNLIPSVNHFDGNPKPHYHFVCKNCNRVIDLDLPQIIGIENHVRELTDYKIESHILNFFGLCENCKEEEIL